MEEEIVETYEVPRVGDMLRAARKKKKLSLEDIASRTRIPLRHLESLEASDWAHLPAPTYSVGFAKSYASVVDLDRNEVGEKLREEMGGTRPTPMAPAEVFEPADPARSMPKWLVLGGLIAVAAVVGFMMYLQNRSLNDGAEVPANAIAPTTPAPVAPPPAAVAQGPVVLSAREPLWMAVYDLNGTSYFSGMLSPGTDFPVPSTALAPLLKTAKPEALKIMVGTSEAPPVGSPGQKVSDVSLLPQDLMKDGPAAPSASSAAPATSQPAPTSASRPVAKPVSKPKTAAAAPAPVAAPVTEPAAPTTNGTE